MRTEAFTKQECPFPGVFGGCVHLTRKLYRPNFENRLNSVKFGKLLDQIPFAARQISPVSLLLARVQNIHSAANRTSACNENE